MTQFSDPAANPYDAYGQSIEPRKTGGLAITALVLSLMGIIPCCGVITAPIGVILGLIGIATLGPTAMRKGRGMSIAAVIVGIVLTVVQICLIMWVFNMMMKPVMEGPLKAMEAGFSGDYTAFKQEFTGAGASATDAEAQAFIDTLRSRYGQFMSCELDKQSSKMNQPTPGQQQATFPYIFRFGNQTVSSEAEIIFADNQGFVMKWSEIRIIDPDKGDLVYPPSAAAPNTPPPATPPPADADQPAEPPTDDGG